MKSFIKNLGLHLFYITLLLASCQKENDLNVSSNIPQDTINGPVIVIKTPTAGASFRFGDTVQISGTIEHDFTLHEYLIRVENLTSGEVLHDQLEHVHFGSRVDFFHPWKNPLQENAALRITIRANDHGDRYNSANLTIQSIAP